MFSWLARRRRRRILAEPFPDEWLGYLQRNVTHYRYLSDEEKKKLRDDVQVFVAEKHWEGCGGLEMTDEIKVTVAAQACLLVLAREHDFFPKAVSILVYPYGYMAPQKKQLAAGIVEEGPSARLGESWYRGPVVLSWADVNHGGHRGRRGANLVFHEFAHQLDMVTGPADGAPQMDSPEQQDRWREVTTREYEALVDRAEYGRPTLLDKYGATNPAEFFAVATECFFERPVELRRRHPELYEVLRQYFRQDPAERVRRSEPDQAEPDAHSNVG